MTTLTFLLCDDRPLDAASCATNLIGENGDQFQLCEAHRALGRIHRSKGETEKAISHFKAALEIATPSNWHNTQFWDHYSLAELFCDDGRFEDAQAHIEHAKPYAVDGPYYLAHMMWLQAIVRRKQHRLEEARSEVLRAADGFKKLEDAGDMELCMELLQEIQEELDAPV